MAKLTLTDVTSGYGTAAIINANNAAVEAALELTLSRDGTATNTMSAALDMNNQRINNLPNAVNNSEPLTLSQAASIATTDTALTRTNIAAALTGGTPQTLSGAGAVDTTSPTTWVVTTGADALTLADGTEGDQKFIVMKTDGGDGTLTPTSLGNGSTITFDDVGDSAHLLFTNAAWHFMGGTATLA